MKTVLTVLAVCAAVFAATLPAMAHHAFAAEFDNSKFLSMKGKFLKMDWVNPHSWVHFEVTLPNGSKQVWEAETPPPNQLTRSGWSRNLLKAGDEIQVTGYAARDGSLKMWGQTVTLLATEGKTLEQPKQVWSFGANPDAAPGGLLPQR